MVLFPVTLIDFYLAQFTLFSTFCVAFYIFVTGGDRDFKFDKYVG